MSTTEDATADELLTIGEAARRLGLNKSTVSRQVQSGKLRLHNGKLRWPEVCAYRSQVEARRTHCPHRSQQSALPKASVARKALQTERATTNATRRATLRAAAGVMSLSAAAKQLGLNKSTLSRQAQAGQLRRHADGVQLEEVCADRAANLAPSHVASWKKRRASSAAISCNAEALHLRDVQITTACRQLMGYCGANMLSGPDLCRLIDRPYDWFEQRRRRARQLVDLPEIEPGQPFPVTDGAELIGALPVRDLAGGRRAHYDACDALMMAIACAGEAVGMTFSEAARLAWNAGAPIVLSGKIEGDLYLGRIVAHTGETRHVCDTWRNIEAWSVADDGPPLNAILINASAVLRRLKLRASELGLATAFDWSVN